MTPWTHCGLTVEQWLALPLSVRIHVAASLYLGWEYTAVAPRAAFLAPGFPASLATGPNHALQTNCTTFTASMIAGLYPDRGYTMRHYAQLQCYEGEPPDSPIRAVESLGVGHRVETWQPRRWHLAQGWRRYAAGDGHAFFACPTSPTELLILHADLMTGPAWLTRQTRYLYDRYTDGLHLAALEA